MRKQFQAKSRKGWQAEYKFHDGQVQRLSFPDQSSAQSWLDDMKKQDGSAQGPAFGGPSRITVGRFLGEYAAPYTLGKQGYQAAPGRALASLSEPGQGLVDRLGGDVRDRRVADLLEPETKTAGNV